MDNAVMASLIISIKKIYTYYQKQEVEDSLEDLIKRIAELYVRPNRDMETNKEVINQP